MDLQWHLVSWKMIRKSCFHPASTSQFLRPSSFAEPSANGLQPKVSFRVYGSEEVFEKEKVIRIYKMGRTSMDSNKGDVEMG